MKKLVLSAVASVALAGSPLAAWILPMKAPPMVARLRSSSGMGFHIGGHSPGGALAAGDEIVNFLPSQAAFGFADFILEHDRDQLIGGGQIGYNWQIANWVIGFEADISYSDMRSTATAGPLAFFPPRAPCQALSIPRPGT